MAAVQRVDQLGGDAHPVAALAHAAFQHILHAELLGHLAHVGRRALVGKARIAGDHKEPVEPRQRGDDVLGDAVGEIFLLGIARHVLERQHRD